MAGILAARIRLAFISESAKLGKPNRPTMSRTQGLETKRQFEPLCPVKLYRGLPNHPTLTANGQNGFAPPAPFAELLQTRAIEPHVHVQTSNIDLHTIDIQTLYANRQFERLHQRNIRGLDRKRDRTTVFQRKTTGTELQLAPSVETFDPLVGVLRILPMACAEIRRHGKSTDEQNDQASQYTAHTPNPLPVPHFSIAQVWHKARLRILSGINSEHYPKRRRVAFKRPGLNLKAVYRPRVPEPDQVGLAPWSTG